MTRFPESRGDDGADHDNDGRRAARAMAVATRRTSTPTAGVSHLGTSVMLGLARRLWRAGRRAISGPRLGQNL